MACPAAHRRVCDRPTVGTRSGSQPATEQLKSLLLVAPYKRLVDRFPIPPDPLEELIHRRGAGLEAKMVEALLRPVVGEAEALGQASAPYGVRLGPDQTEGFLVGGGEDDASDHHIAPGHAAPFPQFGSARL